MIAIIERQGEEVDDGAELRDLCLGTTGSSRKNASNCGQFRLIEGIEKVRADGIVERTRPRGAIRR